jgi:hypothetical protein
LLPPESIRFFAVDQWYLSAMLDGGLSSVRTPTLCPEHCRAGEPTLLNQNPPGPITGFLFRSAAAAGWPDLEISATPGAAGEPLKRYHRAQLSTSILLCMFRGDATSVTISQRTGAVHLIAPAPASGVIDPSQYRSSSELANKLLDRPQTLRISIQG